MHEPVVRGSIVGRVVDHVRHEVFGKCLKVSVCSAPDEVVFVATALTGRKFDKKMIIGSVVHAHYYEDDDMPGVYVIDSIRGMGQVEDIRKALENDPNHIFYVYVPTNTSCDPIAAINIVAQSWYPEGYNIIWYKEKSVIEAEKDDDPYNRYFIIDDDLCCYDEMGSPVDHNLSKDSYRYDLICAEVESLLRFSRISVTQVNVRNSPESTPTEILMAMTSYQERINAVAEDIANGVNTYADMQPEELLGLLSHRRFPVYPTRLSDHYKVGDECEYELFRLEWVVLKASNGTTLEFSQTFLYDTLCCSKGPYDPDHLDFLAQS